MAEDEEKSKVMLLGNLFVVVENIISPKPKNVWHVPGAIQRLHQPITLILQHGGKEGVKLWKLIFGLRVLRPDIWPTLALKPLENKITQEELLSHWIELSLLSYNLSEQVKTLLEEKERLNQYFHEWAFFRVHKYVTAALIILEALEKNSQDILATIDPSLMVNYFCIKKKEVTHLLPALSIDMCEASQTKSDCKDQINSVVKVFSNDCLSAEDEEVDGNGTIYRVSPSCLEIHYNLSILSDSERNQSNKSKINAADKIAKGASTEVVGTKNAKDSSVIRKFKPRKRVINRNIVDPNYHENKGVDFSFKKPNCANLPSSSTSTSDPKEYNKKMKGIVSNTDIVAPSDFLFEYLASKPNIQNRRSTSPFFLENNDHISSLPNSRLDVPQCQTFLSNNDPLNECTSISKTKSEATLMPAASKCTISNDKITSARHVRSHSDGSKLIVPEPSLFSISSTKKFKGPPNSSSEKSLFSSKCDKNFIRKRFMDDGGHSITPDADGFFPHPQPGQNLMDFLSSPQFSKTSAQLDKENAHFNIAEAVLAAIEQMNFDSAGCRKECKLTSGIIPDESEDDLFQNRRTIPLRRRPRLRTRTVIDTATSDDDPVTTDYSVLDSARSSAESSDSEFYQDNAIGHQMDNSPAPSSENSSIHSNDPSSAENVAISLLMHFNTNLLPQANELQWLVSEQDAPQKLLPMPNSVAVSPDDADVTYITTLLRGTAEWAPPRPQLILTLHSNTKRTACLTLQKWRCAGCGLKVSEKLSRHFRLCYYLGRYFCTNCHSNKKSIIPARVLHKWDFKKYYVCNFSSELLSRMSSDPLFHIGSLNPKLYRQSRDLHQTHIYRLQLYHTRIYINICSRAIKEKAMLASVPLHWSSDPHLYSLDDLAAVKQGQMVNNIRQLTTSSISHISSCKVCLGQGFICEICGQGSPIFPFQLDAVTQCTKCRECFHFLCFSPVSSCPRCARRDKREKDLRSKEEPKVVLTTT